jgi:hypothetical protein
MLGKIKEHEILKMPPSGTLRRMAFTRTDVSEERSASIIRVTRIGELGTLSLNSKRRTLHFFAASVGCWLD